MKHLRVFTAVLAAAVTLLPLDVRAISGAGSQKTAEERTSAVVMLEEGASVSAQTLQAAVPDLTVDREFSALFSGFSVEAPRNALPALAAIPGVESAWAVETYEAPTAAASAEAVSEALLYGDGNQDSTGQGTLIAVVDTGIDLTHNAFDVDAQALGTTVLNKNSAALDQTFVYGRYVSGKLPFVYDYGDMDTDVTDQNGHGTAMAGAAAGYDPEAGFSGAAPGAQLAVMKVYGDNGKTTTDKVFAAMEDACQLGADVICVSFGQRCGFSYDQGLETAAFGHIFETLERAGVVVCCAAGDDGTQAEYNSVSQGSVLASYADYGTVASPASYEGAVSVASATNTSTPQYVLTVGRENIPYQAPSGQETLLTEKLGGQSYAYEIAGEGGEAEYETILARREAEETADKPFISVVRRGGGPFSDLAQKALDAGASALVIINSDNDLPPFWAEGAGIPVVMVTLENGNRLEAANLKIMSIPTKRQSVSESGPRTISASSSWGTTPELTISPNLSGTGDNVLAPQAEGEYDYVSGAGMAAAETAGRFACVLSHLKNTSSLGKYDRAELAKDLIYSTADILGDSASPVSVRQQGAGLADAESAMDAVCYIAGPLQELGDDPEESGVYTMDLTVRNKARWEEGCPTEQFADVGSGDWYHESVDFVVSEGLFNGISQTEFAPGNTLTRAQMVTVLYRLEGEPRVRSLNTFSDVPDGSYYEEAVTWARENGIVNGTTATTFSPASPVTREQMVTILYRYGGARQDTAALREYLDRDQVSTYALTAMAWAVDQGIITSTSSERMLLSPKGKATRAQFAAVLTRYLDSNPVAAVYTPYSLVMGDTAQKDAGGIQRNLLTAKALDYDVSFSCGDTLTMNRWTEEKTVTVTIRLSSACRRDLRNSFENGSFVEGFVGFRSETEDIHATFLAFFGDWEAAPILETADFQDVLQAEYQLSADHSDKTYFALLPMNTDANLASLYCDDKFSGDYGRTIGLLGENPLETKPYLADRCALSTSSDALAGVLQIGVRQLRNARSVTVTIQDKSSGKYYLKETRTDSRKSLWSDGAWQFSQTFQWRGTDMQGRALADGTEVTVRVYASLDGRTERLEWSFSCAVDASAPELHSQLNEDGSLTITARDGRYLAGITVVGYDGQTVKQETYADNARNTAHSLTLTKEELERAGNLTITATDYASNVTELKFPAEAA